MNNRIKELRKEKKLTVKELANLIGISQSMLSNYENGNSTPRDNETWAKLAEHLDADVGYIMGVSNYRTAKDLENLKISPNYSGIDLDKNILKDNLTLLTGKKIDDLVLRDSKFVDWLQGVIFAYQTLKESKQEVEHFDDLLKNSVQIISLGKHLNDEPLLIKSYEAKDAAIEAIQKLFDDQNK